MTRIRLVPRNLIAVAYDVLVASAAWTITFVARYNFTMASEPREALFTSLPVVVVIELVCFIWFGLYRGIWRYASMYDIKRIVTAVGISALIVPVAFLLWRHGLGIPRVLYFLNPLLLILFMGGGRIVYRWWKEHRQFNLLREQGKPVLVMGAGDGARRLLSELERSSTWQVIGMLDDNRAKVGREIAGYTVLGSWDEVADVAQRTSARHVIFATPGASAAARRRAFELCERAGLHLLIVPELDQIISGTHRISELREIELDDLLGRAPVQLDTKGLSQLIGNQTVLITGAGGSIGSELCRQIARFAPRALVLYELSEYALYQVVEDLQRLYPAITVWAVVGDVKDRQRVDETFERFLPSIVFHAAAYKHVPMLEELNAWQAVRNNALGTRIVADTASRHQVRKLVFVSTDKAVNPTNVMGATKRLAELMLQLAHAKSGLTVVIVRFGNVLGSSGSVIPKFREQIARGGPVTVTHPDITRYFMSITEASQLVLQAGLMGKGGEIFVLDMGEPVRIADLARDLIRLSGLPEESIGIEYTGLRAGEKLYEELLAADEATLPTHHKKLRIQRSLDLPQEQWSNDIDDWLSSRRSFDDAEVRGWLKHLVPEYLPPEGLPAIAPSEQKEVITERRANDDLQPRTARLVLVATGTNQSTPDTQPKPASDKP
jgi:FlaA1/EpsC-like NDP-sugar epimerase